MRGHDERCGVLLGANGQGQLGDGTTDERLIPTRVGGSVSFTQIGAGTLHTCGVSAGRAAYCWGKNSFGELGDGTGIGWMQPALVAGGLPFVQVSAGDDHSCGVTADQRAYRWGDNARAVMAGSVTALTLAASPQREWRDV